MYVNLGQKLGRNCMMRAKISRGGFIDRCILSWDLKDGQEQEEQIIFQGGIVVTKVEGKGIRSQAYSVIV